MESVSRRRMLFVLGGGLASMLPGAKLAAIVVGKQSWLHSVYVERQRPPSPYDDTVTLRVLSRVAGWRLYSATMDVLLAPETRLIQEQTEIASLDGLWPIRPHSHTRGADGLWREQVTLLTPAREHRQFWLVPDADSRYRTERLALVVGAWPTDGVVRVTP